MVIRTKKDVENMISQFDTKAEYDDNGKKHYFVLDDNKRKGKWTLMKYADGVFTLHGRGETYCDQGEQVLHEVDLKKFIWTNRKAFNEALKMNMQNA